MQYAEDCSSCHFSQGIIRPSGGIVKLLGDWTVNQFGGSEGYLGWLALQPQFHRMALSDLTMTELAALGPNLQALDRVLTQHWHNNFSNDRVQRVYVVYFFESAFRRPPEPKPFHLHIHVIPRYESLFQPGGLYVSRDGVTWADGWQVPLLSDRGIIPEPYRRESPLWETMVQQMMDFIGHELGVGS